MRVLMVNKFAHVTGGADQHCLALAAALRGRGHAVAFLSTASGENVETAGAFVPSTVTNASRDGMSRGRKVRTAATALWSRDAASATSALLAEFRPDVVHVHKLYPQLSVAPVVIAARAGVPVVQTAHDAELVAANPVDERGRRFDMLEERLSYRLLNSATYVLRSTLHRRCLSHVVVPSRFLAGRYRAHGLRVTVLPNFTDLASVRTPTPSVREGIVFVGRVHATKGIEDVFEVARRLPATSVVVVGDGPLVPMVREQAGRLANLTYAGRLDAAGVAQLLRASKVAVMPSRVAEGGPLAALEAMAVGTPVVAYPRGGLAEYVSDASGGRIVSPRVELLVGACRELLEDGALWERLSANARRTVVRVHSPAAYVAGLERTYGEATACAS